MLTKTTNKTLQYTLIAALILMTALTVSAFSPGPFNSDHCQANVTTNCGLTVQDFRVKETLDQGLAVSAASPYTAEAARWLTAADYYIIQSSNQQVAARHLTTADFHVKEAADAAGAGSDARFPNNSNRH